MRASLSLSLLLSLLSLSCQKSPRPPAPPAPSSERETFLAMFARGYFPGRTGQIFVVPEKGSFLLSRPDDFYRFMHGSPWDYDVDVPLLFYGEPFVRKGTFSERATQQDVAPTLASVLGFPPPTTMTGRALSSALTGAEARPKVVALAVLDGLGRRSMEGLKTLSRMRREGAFFENMTIDYLPTVTSAGHATIATGTDPRFHGVNANATFDRRTGESDGPFPGLSPSTYMVLTLADHWNLASRGRAVILTQGTTARAAVAIAGFGGCAVNAKPFVLAMFDERSAGWVSNPECFRLPAYLEDDKAAAVWKSAGGSWMGHRADDGRTFLRTALFPRFQMDALLEMIEKESAGEDDVPDLVVASFKTPDYVSHQYGPDSPEMEAALAALDEELGRLIAKLQERAGAGRFVVAVTADHGMPREPDGPGQTRRYVEDIVDAVHDRFDPRERRLVLDFSDPANHQLFVDEARLFELGLRMRGIADFLEELPFLRFAFTEEEVRAVRAPGNPGVY